MNNHPKVLIVSREVWIKSTASTLTNLFEDYDPDKLAHIYIETKTPSSNCCHRYFQISEFALVHKLFKWRMKTGHRIYLKEEKSANTSLEKIASQEAATMQYVRGHRSPWFTIAREILWAFNGWKSKDLKLFIQDFNPDVIWIMGSPLILMNRLSQYVAKVSGKPYCVFEMDDVYPSKRFVWNPFRSIYRASLRRNVKRLIQGASQLYVISPKMKREYDALFGTDSIVITKGINFANRAYHPYSVHSPIQMVYMGQVIYDRISSLELIGKAIDEINMEEQRLILNIYTKNPIDEKRKAEIVKKNGVVFHQPVPYSLVNSVIEQNDIVVFVESLRNEFKNVARLSFSTKITDYLASGKCIFAVGREDSAPIDYFIENDAAIVACDYDEIKARLQLLLLPEIVEAYSLKAFSCGRINHDKATIDNLIYGKFRELANTNN